MAAMNRSSQMVPIIVYHSIADPHAHVLRKLSLPVALFERQLAYLRKHGFQSMDLHDIQHFLRDGRSLPPKALAITFDDGYLGNWVYAFPLLKRYGMKVTVFVATDFIDTRELCRPTLENVWAGRIAQHELEWWGHLSWTELQRMQDSGLVDVQSHTRSHDWQFSSDRVVNFYNPGADYHSLYWLSHPQHKVDWLNADISAHIPLGRPIYEHRPCLLGEAYHEPSALAAATTAHVAAHGGPTFFQRPDWRAQLHEVVAAYRRDGGEAGHRESSAAYLARVREEFDGSKTIIETQLGKPVHLLCWPRGDYSAQLQRIAIEECGYAATVNVARVTNRYGDDPHQLRRLGFEQDYAGPLRRGLVYLNFVGVMNYRSGRASAYPLAPITRRLMPADRALQSLIS